MTEPARDEALDAASAMVERATILRGFYEAEELQYDAEGKVRGPGKVVDWTLAGVDVQKVGRRADGMIELEGVRVAIRYNPNQHTFERHAQKGEDANRVSHGDARQVRAALAAIFLVGMDPALLQSMPPYWRHYFVAGADWGVDDLAGLTIIPANSKATDPKFPVLISKSEPGFTGKAMKDQVKGTVQLRMVVGMDGVPRRIAVGQPLGYGLDERAVAVAAKYRFQPGTQNGKPMAMEVMVNQGSDVPPQR